MSCLLIIQAAASRAASVSIDRQQSDTRRHPSERNRHWRRGFECNLGLRERRIQGHLGRVESRTARNWSAITSAKRQRARREDVRP